MAKRKKCLPQTKGSSSPTLKQFLEMGDEEKIPTQENPGGGKMSQIWKHQWSLNRDKILDLVMKGNQFPAFSEHHSPRGAGASQHCGEAAG